MRNSNAKLTPSHNLQTIFIFLVCHRIICSKIWAFWIITDLVHRSFCSSSEWWLRGIRLAWEFYYCKLNFLMLWCSQMLCCCSHYVQPVAYLRVNPQVEEVPEYLKTIPALFLLLYCTYNALSKYILSYINKTFMHYSFCFMGSTRIDKTFHKI